MRVVLRPLLRVGGPRVARLCGCRGGCAHGFPSGDVRPCAGGLPHALDGHHGRPRVRPPGAVTQWRGVRDVDNPVKAESAAWDVAVTCSGLLWALVSAALTISRRAGLVAAFLSAVG